MNIKMLGCFGIALTLALALFNTALVAYGAMSEYSSSTMIVLGFFMLLSWFSFGRVFVNVARLVALDHR